MPLHRSRQQNDFIDVLFGAHGKTSDLMGKGELICEAREILHFYLLYQTYSDDAVALDGDATICASGDNVFNEEEEEEVRGQGLAVTWCVWNEAYCDRLLHHHTRWKSMIMIRSRRRMIMMMVMMMMMMMMMMMINLLLMMMRRSEFKEIVMMMLIMMIMMIGMMMIMMVMIMMMIWR